MGEAYLEDTIVTIRMAVLAGIIIFGIPGNVIALITNMKVLENNPLNGVLYLHLAVVDFLLCSLYAIGSLVIEAVRYTTQKDLGEEFFHVMAIAYYTFTFISVTSLTLIAILRCWRIFNPFGIVRKGILFGIICLTDATVCIMTAFLKLSDGNWLNQGNVLDSKVWKDNDSANGTAILSNSSRHDMPLDWMTTSTDLRPGNLSLTQDSFVAIQAPAFNFSLVLRYSGMVCVAMTVLCYVLICLKLHQYKREMGEIDIVQKRQFLNRQTKNLVTQVILFMLFLGTQAPIIIQAYLEVSFALFRLCLTIGVTNNAINPFLYCLLLPVNRQMVRRLFSRTVDEKRTSIRQGDNSISVK